MTTTPRRRCITTWVCLKNSRIISIDYYPDESLDEHFRGMVFKFNEAVSFEVTCADQQEVDYYWEKLSAVPESEQCGWCKDRYGVSWQIAPERPGELLTDPGTEAAGRAMQAMMKMHKIDIGALEAAFAG